MSRSNPRRWKGIQDAAKSKGKEAMGLPTGIIIGSMESWLAGPASSKKRQSPRMTLRYRHRTFSRMSSKVFWGLTPTTVVSGTKQLPRAMSSFAEISVYTDRVIW